MRRRSARPEDVIQRAVFAHLRQRGAPGVFAFHVPNGGKRKQIEAAIMKGLGVTAGVPDVIAIRDGHCYGLEIKSDDGKLSPRQTESIEAMERAGATVVVTKGLNEAIRQIERWGLVRGVAA